MISGECTAIPVLHIICYFAFRNIACRVLLTLRWQRPNWGVVVVGQVLTLLLSRFHAYNASSECTEKYPGNLYSSDIGSVDLVSNNQHRMAAPPGFLWAVSGDLTPVLDGILVIENQTRTSH